MPTLAAMAAMLLLTGSITAAAAASSANIALPGRKSKCGDVDIPYPFGTTPGCYRSGFMVACNEMHRRPKLFLDNGVNSGPGPEVVKISLANSTVRVESWVSYFVTSNTSDVQLVISRNSSFVLSAKANSLVIMGCGFRVLLHIVEGWTYGSCASFCPVDNSTGRPFLPDVVCNGIGCCQPSIPVGLRSCRIELSPLDGDGTCSVVQSPAPPPAPRATFNVSIHMVEQEWWSDPSHVYGLQQYFIDLPSYPDMSPFFVPAKKPPRGQILGAAARTACALTPQMAPTATSAGAATVTRAILTCPMDAKVGKIVVSQLKPTVLLSEGVNLVAHFILLFNQDRLSEILDAQVSEEACNKASEVAAMAVMCLRMKGEDRPTMQYVHMKLQGLLSVENTMQGNPEKEQNPVGLRYTTFQRSSNNGADADDKGNTNGRRYSMEEAMLLSANLQR